ncbi:Oidioi.mRNA.OKI2018_I69.XSR.g15978.t1.cds [Oikopleura dioica]|uniref:Oidioi.mRNA.OKI2018_I69.XSR.g15978.t1.cds n=1 Tax=Oikopleura dioica TaxID=34765 RepID=A0ABN7SF45_OIKDI|nr:Oidioi.mRNA.OKI2018_I69.XSR.g15978.t1.cds [Oikopleura dioica]
MPFKFYRMNLVSSKINSKERELTEKLSYVLSYTKQHIPSSKNEKTEDDIDDLETEEDIQTLTAFQKSVGYVTHRCSIVGMIPAVNSERYLTIGKSAQRRPPPLIKRSDVEAMGERLDMILSATASARSSTCSTMSFMSNASRRKRSNFSWTSHEQNVRKFIEDEMLSANSLTNMSVSNNQSRKYSRRRRRRLKEIYRSMKKYFSCRRKDSSSSSENISPLPIQVQGNAGINLADLRNRRQSYSTMQMNNSLN